MKLMARNGSTTKRCPGCGEVKDRATEFYVNVDKHGVIESNSAYCRNCHNSRKTERRRKSNVDVTAPALVTASNLAEEYMAKLRQSGWV